MADDTSIPDETRLYRRLHPEQVIWDDNERRVRPSSAAFKDEFLSISLGNELARISEPPSFALRDHPQHSLGWLTAEFARAEEQAVASIPTDTDPTHGEVVGRKKGARSTRLAKKVQIEILRREFLRPDVQARLRAESA